MLTSEERKYLRDLDLPTSPTGILFITPTGDIRDISGKRNATKAVLNRIVARKNSMTHRPEYGTIIQDSVEDVGTPAIRSSMANDARRNLLRDFRISEAAVTASEGRPDNPLELTSVTISMIVQFTGEEDEAQLEVLL